MAYTQEVTEQDIMLFERHIIDYSDDYRFVGYEHDMEQLLERTEKAKDSIRGMPLDDVSELVDKQFDIVRLKEQAFMNIVGANEDEKYHLNDHVVTSFATKLIDDRAVAEVMSLSVRSAEHRGYAHFYEPGDAELRYATYTHDGSDRRYDGSFDVETVQGIREVLEGQNVTDENLEVYDNESFGYVDGVDDFMTGVTQKALFRGREVAEIWQFIEQTEDGEYVMNPEEDIFDSKMFVVKNNAREHDAGIYKIEDGEVYRYNYEETEVQKISGKDSVFEYKDKLQIVGHLDNFRQLAYRDVFEGFQRFDDFSFDSEKVDPYPGRLYHVPYPEMKPIENEKELEQEDDLEL